MFTSNSFRRSPDQTVYELNNLSNKVDSMKASVRLTSPDGKECIILGNQPTDPSTRKPFSFGIHTYKVKGDRLEEVGSAEKDYNSLSNKPSINNVTLVGNKTTEDLKIKANVDKITNQEIWKIVN